MKAENIPNKIVLNKSNLFNLNPALVKHNNQ